MELERLRVEDSLVAWPREETETSSCLGTNFLKRKALIYYMHMGICNISVPNILPVVLIWRYFLSRWRPPGDLGHPPPWWRRRGPLPAPLHPARPLHGLRRLEHLGHGRRRGLKEGAGGGRGRGKPVLLLDLGRVRNKRRWPKREKEKYIWVKVWARKILTGSNGLRKYRSGRKGYFQEGQNKNFVILTST